MNSCTTIALARSKKEKDKNPVKVTGEMLRAEYVALLNGMPETALDLSP
jgi:hypothetical protein